MDMFPLLIQWILRKENTAAWHYEKEKLENIFQPHSIFLFLRQKVITLINYLVNPFPH